MFVRWKNRLRPLLIFTICFLFLYPYLFSLMLEIIILTASNCFWISCLLKYSKYFLKAHDEMCRNVPCIRRELPFDRQFTIDWSRSRSLEFLIVRSFSIDQKQNDWSMIEINQIHRFKFLLLYLRLNISSNYTATNYIIQWGSQRFLHHLSLLISIYFKAKTHLNMSSSIAQT
jgi:hypothetical protein